MPHATRWKRSLLVFVLAVVAAACAEPSAPQVSLGSGVRFLPQVADSLADVGRNPAVVTNADGLPVVAYFGLKEQLAKGEVPVARPVIAPSLPGILLATVSLTQAVLAGQPLVESRHWLQLLAVADLVYVVLGLLTFEFILDA